MNSTAVQLPPRALLIVSRVRHHSTRIFKKGVPQSGLVTLHPSHGFNNNAAGFCSLECHQSTIFKTAVSSISVLSQIGHVYGELTEEQQPWRQQTWFGYWIGPEDIDGWGFVEAYLLPT